MHCRNLPSNLNKMTAQLQTKGGAGQGDRRMVHHPPTSALGGKERRQTHLVVPLYQGSGLGSGPQTISRTVYPSRLDQKAWASEKLVGSLFQSKTSGVCGWGRMRLKGRCLQPSESPERARHWVRGTQSPHTPTMSVSSHSTERPKPCQM